MVTYHKQRARKMRCRCRTDASRCGAPGLEHSSVVVVCFCWNACCKLGTGQLGPAGARRILWMRSIAARVRAESRQVQRSNTPPQISTARSHTKCMLVSACELVEAHRCGSLKAATERTHGRSKGSLEGQRCKRGRPVQAHSQSYKKSSMPGPLRDCATSRRTCAHERR